MNSRIRNGITVQTISTVVFSWNCARLVPDRLPVLEDRVEHHAEHDDEDDDADPEDERVQVDDLPRDRRHRRLQVPLERGERRARRQQRRGNDRLQQPEAGPETRLRAHHVPLDCVQDSVRRVVARRSVVAGVRASRRRGASVRFAHRQPGQAGTCEMLACDQIAAAMTTAGARARPRTRSRTRRQCAPPPESGRADGSPGETHGTPPARAAVATGGRVARAGAASRRDRRSAARAGARPSVATFASASAIAGSIRLATQPASARPRAPDRQRRQQRVVEAAEPDADDEQHRQAEPRGDVEHVRALATAAPSRRRRPRRRRRPARAASRA